MLVKLVSMYLFPFSAAFFSVSFSLTDLSVLQSVSKVSAYVLRVIEYRGVHFIVTVEYFSSEAYYL